MDPQHLDKKILTLTQPFRVKIGGCGDAYESGAIIYLLKIPAKNKSLACVIHCYQRRVKNSPVIEREGHSIWVCVAMCVFNYQRSATVNPYYSFNMQRWTLQRKWLIQHKWYILLILYVTFSASCVAVCRHSISYTIARIGCFLKILHVKINHPSLTKPTMPELCDCPHHRVGVLQNHYIIKVLNKLKLGIYLTNILEEIEE